MVTPIPKIPQCVLSISVLVKVLLPYRVSLRQLLYRKTLNRGWLTVLEFPSVFIMAWRAILCRNICWYRSQVFYIVTQRQAEDSPTASQEDLLDPTAQIWEFQETSKIHLHCDMQWHTCKKATPPLIWRHVWLFHISHWVSIDNQPHSTPWNP